MTNKYTCGLCKYTSTRKGLRDHLQKEHRIMKQIAGEGFVNGKGYIHKRFWQVEEMK